MAVDIDDVKTAVQAEIDEATNTLTDALAAAVTGMLADSMEEVLDSLVDDVECDEDNATSYIDEQEYLVADDDDNESLADPDSVRESFVATYTAGYDAAVAMFTERVKDAKYRGYVPVPIPAATTAEALLTQ